MLAILSSLAFARPAPVITTEFGREFVTVGSPGNRHMLPVERRNNINPTPVTVNLGGVGHSFRVGRTEVTTGEWLTFVRLAWPVWREIGGNTHGGEWTGHNIANFGTLNNPSFAILRPGEQEHPTNGSWRAAAMFANWSHHGRPTGTNVSLDVFRTGAYDTSTFTRNPDGSYNDQVAHSPGARFWIPTLDEWTKAAYYDPDRYAPGNPGPTWGAGPPTIGGNPPPPMPGDPPITGQTDGYWLYPHTSQEFPINGPPGVGHWSGLSMPVGSYPEVMTPWGALDMLGGATEWTETVIPGVNPISNRYRAVRWNDSFNAANDDAISGTNTDFSARGFRLASAIPSPGLGAYVLAGGATLSRRRRT